MIMTVASSILEMAMVRSFPLKVKGEECDDHDHNKPSSGKEIDGGHGHTIPSFRNGGDGYHDHFKPSFGKE